MHSLGGAGVKASWSQKPGLAFQSISSVELELSSWSAYHPMKINETIHNIPYGCSLRQFKNSGTLLYFISWRKIKCVVVAIMNICV